MIIPYFHAQGFTRKREARCVRKHVPTHVATVFCKTMSRRSRPSTADVREDEGRTTYCEVSIFEPSRNVLSLGNSWRENA